MRSYLNDDALTDTELKLRTPAVKAVIAAIKSRIETLTAEEVGKAVREGRDPAADSEQPRIAAAAFARFQLTPEESDVLVQYENTLGVERAIIKGLENGTMERVPDQPGWVRRKPAK
jgi:hypothetical protein